MVTKTKLGLLCAALMMILGTQGVDAQLLRQGQMARYDAGAPNELKALPNTSGIAESNAVKADGFSSPMNRAPRRADSRLTADATHTKAWFQAKTYTWYDANNVAHTANYTDEATDPYQIYYFLSDVYSNKDIPGIQYSGIMQEELNYRWPFLRYYSSSSNYTNRWLGWGRPDGEGYIHFPVDNPTENGYTPLLVKVKDGELESYTWMLGDSLLIDNIGKIIDGVELLTDGLRVDEGGDQAGTVFTYTGELNRFFFIGKGKNFEQYSGPGFEEIGSVTFSGTGTYTLSSPWSGSVKYWSSSGGYYMPSGEPITYTIPSGVTNAEFAVVINTVTSGYFKITTKNGSKIYTANANSDNEYDLEGTLSSGDVITILGCTSNGANTANPDMASSGIQIYAGTGISYKPTGYYYGSSSSNNYYYGYAPFYDMFEEFSPTTLDAGAEITDFYSEMMQGNNYPILHDCTGVIALEHFFSMSGKDGTEKKSLSNLVLYIPDNRAMPNYRPYDTIHTNLRPQVGLYIIKLQAEIAPDDEQKEHTFDVTVDWESNLDNITNCTVPQTYELHAYWTDPETGVEHDEIIYTGPNTTYTYEVPQYMASYTIEYKVKATPTDATNPDEFYAWSNIDDVIVPGYDDFFMLDRDHYESDFVITSEKNFYRNYLYPKNKDVGGFTPLAIESGMKHFILYRQSTDEGGEPVPAADLYFETANGKVYYKIEYRDEYQHPVNSNNN